jgi:accessory gene regulator protein AgrB
MIEVLEYTGITFGIIGVVLMYKYAVSPNYKKGAATYLYSSEELKAKKIIEDKQEKHYKLMSVIGLLLTVFSMLISLWVRALK